eukprot:1160525-Pelagomonas_calceolata.AAC.10
MDGSFVVPESQSAVKNCLEIAISKLAVFKCVVKFTGESALQAQATAHQATVRQGHCTPRPLHAKATARQGHAPGHCFESHSQRCPASFPPLPPAATAPPPAMAPRGQMPPLP